MKALLYLIISGALVVSGYSQTRNVLVGTNNSVVQPTNFWSADASNARTGLGLGSAATNPASAFQPSSLALSNIASNNGSSLTNIAASNIVGTLSLARGGTGSTNASDARTALGLGTAATNPASAFQPSSLSLSNLASGDGGALTNIQASNLVGTINISNVPVVTLTNIDGTLAVAKGGTGATNASEARQNLGATTVGNAVFVATNAEAARTAINALATNGNAASLTNFPALLLRTNGDGSGVTNISGANVVGAVATASNITGTIAISNVSNLQSSLDGKLGTNPTLAIGNISNLQTTLDGKLGTNPTLQISNIAALQTALDSKLSGTFPIAISNVSGLQTSLDGKLGTNPTLAIANIAGLQTNLDSKLSITGNAVNLTNFPASLLRTTGDASGLTNFPTLNQNTTGTASNVTGIVAIANGGTGTNSAIGARQNLGLVWTGLTNTNAETFRIGLGATTVGSSLFALANPSAIRFLRLNADNTASALSDSDFRTSIGLGTAATNPATAFQTSSANLTNLAANNGTSLTNIPVAGVVGALSTNGSAAGLTNFPASLLTTNGNGAGLTNLTAANITGTVVLASNVTGTIAISNGGSGATTAGGARTNLGLVLPALTNTNIDLFKSAIALGETDIVTFSELILRSGTNSSDIHFSLDSTEMALGVPIVFSFTNQTLNAAISRTNLGLGWSALTNTTASGFQTALFGTGTNPVLVNTNGEVVSPTNFWQEAPITTTFIESQPTTNSSTNISPSRLLHIHSLVTNIVNVTNTIILPTNTLTFEGDMALVVHKGPTNSLTQVRQSGSTNNLITLNKFNEAVEFTYYNNAWQFLETAAFTAPIYFSGTNATANAAASRTNLGLSAPWLTNTNVTNFRTAIGLGATNEVVFESVAAQDISAPLVQSSSGTNSVSLTPDDIEFAGISAATTRTNLGLGATNIVTFAGLTNNGDITINQTATNNGLLYIYRTNAEPFLGLANLIASNNTTISNETLFRVGVSEATNRAAQFGFRSTNTNGNGVAVFSVFGYNALMMVGPSDPNAGTNPIEATIYSVSPANKVATLITTNTGAMQMHRSLGFDTNLSSVGNTNLVPVTNNQISKWLRVYIGTNTFYLPLYQ